jgi:hypothetical protein
LDPQIRQKLRVTKMGEEDALDIGRNKASNAA